MKNPVLLAIVLTLIAAPLYSAQQPTAYTKADSAQIAAVTMADTERTTATIAGDRNRLDTILSEDLRYGHSSGKVDSKASLIAALTSHDTVYESFDYKERRFLPAAPGIVLMTGRVLIHVTSANKKMIVDLNFLSVWREEQGHWRFLSWQSCTNPPAAAAAK